MEKIAKKSTTGNDKAVKKKKTVHRKAKGVRELKKDAWKLFSKLIRLTYSKDGYCKCYTCGREDIIENMQAGHGVGGRGNYVLFDGRIVRVQCYHCNIGLKGNYEVFIPKLIREIGQESYEEIVRRSKIELKRSVPWYRDKIEELKAELEILST